MQLLQLIQSFILMKNNHKRRARKTMRIRNRDRVNRLRKISFRFEPLFILVLIKLDLNKKNAVHIKERLARYISMLTGNVHFLTTSPTIAQLQTAHDELKDLIQSASNGDRIQIELRDIKQTECEDLIRTLSYDIQHQSKGDAEKIHSAGFETRNSKTPPALPGQVLNLKVKTNGFDGQLKLRWKAVPNKLAYVISMTQMPTDIPSWAVVEKSGKASFTVKGLNPGITYYFRVFAFNSLGDGPVSEVANGHC